MTLMNRQPTLRWPSTLDRLFDDWPIAPVGWRRIAEEDQVKVEEFVADDTLVVRAELPGVDPEKDIDISITQGNLCIRGERHEHEETEERNYRRSEIRYGSFSPLLPLPPNTKEEDIKASYRDGILEVRAPLSDTEHRPSKIAIEHS